MAISRRTVFKSGAIVLAAGLIGAGVSGRWGRTIPIKIAGGQQDGVYLQFAKLLADAINTAGLGLNCTPVETEGSVENIRLIGKADAQIGIAMTDVAVAALKGQDPFESAVPIMAIGRVYQNYLQLVVRDNAPLHEVADLRGKKVSLGPDGSGTAMFGRRLFGAIKLDVDKQYLPLRDATTALENGSIDAILWMGGIPTQALAELHNRVKIRLLPTKELLPELRNWYGTVYQQAIIPSGSYGEAAMPTIGVANLLVCASTLANGIAARVARVLLDRPASLVPPDALGMQFLDHCSLIDTDIPMHPGAASVYRREHG